MTLRDPLIVSGPPRRSSSGDARPPAPSPVTGTWRDATESLPSPVARAARARSLLAWLAAGALLGLILVGTAARSESASARRCPQWEALIAAHGLPVATFSRIAHRESRCQPHAVNRRSRTTGLLQLHPVLWRDQRGWMRDLRADCNAPTLASVKDPAKNVCMAAGIYRRLGMDPWRL